VEHRVTTPEPPKSRKSNPAGYSDNNVFDPTWRKPGISGEPGLEAYCQSSGKVLGIRQEITPVEEMQKSTMDLFQMRPPRLYLQ